MARLDLIFSNHSRWELSETCFDHPLLQRPRLAVRGRTAGAFLGRNSFAWSAGVQALCLLACRTVLASLDFGTGPRSHFVMVGEAGSAAACLDYALGKQPAWLHQIFGTDSHGGCLARRIICRSNPERKRPGPVQLSINSGALHPTAVKIQVGEHILQESFELENLACELERSWPGFGTMQRGGACRPAGPMLAVAA